MEVLVIETEPEPIEVRRYQARADSEPGTWNVSYEAYH
jgi:hypothetical protein